MAEYVSRAAIKDALVNKFKARIGACHVPTWNDAFDAVTNIPTADVVERPNWIPVTERLPDADEDVLLQFPNNQAAGFCDRDGCWGVYSGDGFYTEVADNEPKPTHWAKKLPEPPKEDE